VFEWIRDFFLDRWYDVVDLKDEAVDGWRGARPETKLLLVTGAIFSLCWAAILIVELQWAFQATPRDGRDLESFYRAHPPALAATILLDGAFVAWCLAWLVKLVALPTRFFLRVRDRQQARRRTADLMRVLR